MAFPPQKKPGIEVAIGVGKGGPPRPPSSMMGAPKMPGMEDDMPPADDEGAETSGWKECSMKLEENSMKLDKIMEALGIDSGSDSGEAPPMDDMSGGSMGDES